MLFNNSDRLISHQIQSENNNFQNGFNEKSIDSKLEKKNHLHDPIPSNIQERPLLQQGNIQQSPSLQITQNLQQNVIGSFTQSQRNLQFDKIYGYSIINSLILQIRQIIHNQIHQRKGFCALNPGRQKQITIYNTKLLQLDQILQLSLGTIDEMKIYKVKKVLEILKTVGKFQSQNQFDNLMKKVNQIQILKQTKNNQNKTSSLHQKDNLNLPQNFVRRKNRLLTLDLIKNDNIRLMKMKESSKQNGLTISRMNQDEQQYKIVDKRFDSINKQRLKKYKLYNDEIKQFDQRRREIKLKYSSLHSKMLAERKDTNELNSLKIVTSQAIQKPYEISEQEEKQLKEIFETLETQNSRRLSSSLHFLNQKPSKSSSKNQNQIRLKFQPLLKDKKTNSRLILSQNSRLRLPKISESKEKRLKGSPNKLLKKEKISSQIKQQIKIQSNENQSIPSLRKNSFKTQDKKSIEKEVIKTNSVNKSKFREFSSYQNKENKMIKSKQKPKTRLKLTKHSSQQKLNKLKLK